MIVVGLDLSLTNAGIAVLTDGRPTLLTSVGHDREGKSHAHRSRRIVSQTRAIISALNNALNEGTVRRLEDQQLPDLAVIEDQLEHGPMLPSALDRSALWWGVYSSLLAKRIPIAVMNPTTLKAWATGKTRSPIKGEAKRQMLAEVKTWWPAIPVRNDDIGDALALAAMGAFHLGDPMPFEVKDRHRNNMEQVAWPVMTA
jgi:Holliday junction resolvasome RuvABC endonuclease subunit